MQKNYRLDLRHRLALGIDRALQRDVRREHPLEQLFWECTLRCNLACRHCGSDCKIASGTPDMPVEDFLRVLDSINRRCAPHSVFVVVTAASR